jgi:hypothetical protein
VATQATVPKSATVCTDTSECEIGNTGPGGGMVVAKYEERNAEAVNNLYIELAPRGWDGKNDPPIGMPFDVRAKLASYKGGGRSDWRAPSLSEVQYICGPMSMPPQFTDSRSCADALGLFAWFDGREYRGYWTNEKATLPSSSSKNLPFWNFSIAGPDNSRVTPMLRPVRVWTTPKVSLTTVATTPTTTTTTVVLPPVVAWPGSAISTCSDLAKCELGQRGPAGGLIINVQRSSAESVYVEMAPDGWAGTPDKRDPLVDTAGAVRALATFNAGGGQWTLPSPTYIGSICHIAAGRAPDSSGACTDNGRIAPTFGAGGRDAWYWTGQGTDVGGRTDFVSGKSQGDLSGGAFLRPIRLVRFVPPTTTTTIPLSCADGGVCKIGDKSPTGGLIVDFSVAPGTMTYTELAPKTWAGGTTDPGLPKQEAARAVALYSDTVNKGRWTLPTDRQMRAAFAFFAENLTFGPDCRAVFSSWRALTIDQQPFAFGGLAYWLANPTREAKADNFQIATGAAYYDVDAAMRYNVRPFAVQPYRGGGNPTPAAWSTPQCERQTIPTTTTTTVRVPCAGRGVCSIGDVGPHGGIIIGVEFGKVRGDITYTEMRIAPYPNFDCQFTGFGSRCLPGQYDDFMRTIGLTGVFDSYPTERELSIVARSPDLKQKLRMRNDWYFSSTYRVSKTVTGDVNAEGIGDLLQSLEVNDQTTGIAVHMPTGQAKEFNTAFFRGVNRWKCQFGCK